VNLGTHDLCANMQKAMEQIFEILLLKFAVLSLDSVFAEAAAELSKPTGLISCCTVPLMCKQALYEHRPNDVDVQPTEAWLAVMEQAHCNMSR